MKKNNFFGVWKRCERCGTIFSDKLELREHLVLHQAYRSESGQERCGAQNKVNVVEAGTFRRGEIGAETAEH